MLQNEQHGAVLYYAEMESPVGPVTLLQSAYGLCHLEFKTYSEAQSGLSTWSRRWYGEHEIVHSPTQLGQAIDQLNEYFAGERQAFDLQLDLQGTAFQRQVWQALQVIPYGEVVSYKWIAVHIGSPSAVRAVGGANNRNPVSIIVPCHRVIGMNGQMVGYGGGLDRKELLLELEGYLRQPVLF
ncbi:[Fe-S]-binding protein [Paenibacillus bovis]|uniref:Methylated-DNA--protein-cysteine methyltransferase n=1 Tax=Paenibacillus bovis TaxID=1616788 RepID=A0A172ZMZ2_9BACL|nr:[Fe-S]-binding protein [Paenibacillus bovis]